jgi:hypothetical protein
MTQTERGRPPGKTRVEPATALHPTTADLSDSEPGTSRRARARCGDKTSRHCQRATSAPSLASNRTSPASNIAKRARANRSSSSKSPRITVSGRSPPANWSSVSSSGDIHPSVPNKQLTEFCPSFPTSHSVHSGSWPSNQNNRHVARAKHGRRTSDHSLVSEGVAPIDAIPQV